MDTGDKIGLIIILALSLTMLGLSFWNSVLSGYTINDLTNLDDSSNLNQKSMIILTFSLLSLAIVTVIFSYVLHSRTD